MLSLPKMMSRLTGLIISLLKPERAVDIGFWIRLFCLLFCSVWSCLLLQSVISGFQERKIFDYEDLECMSTKF